MGAPIEYYVDPAIAADSGAGTVGDPWGDLQYALNTATRDATNGDRFNVKAGTDEILGAALTLATYGVPTLTAPLYFQGYTAAAADGGIGGISGAATYAIFASTAYDAVHFKDMHLHNCGSATWMIQLDNDCSATNCEIDNCTGGGLDWDTNPRLVGCYIHNIGGVGVAFPLGNANILGNYFANGANSFSAAVNTGSAPFFGSVAYNIFSLSGTSNGMDLAGGIGSVHHNSLFTSGSGIAMQIDADAAGISGSILNNLFEGWTTGILLSAAPTADQMLLAGNAFYNCTTDYTIAADDILLEDNEALGATPFDKAGSDTYALRATYFNAVDTGNVWSPYMGMGGAKGAIQPSAGGGASTLNMIVTGTSSLLKR